MIHPTFALLHARDCYLCRFLSPRVERETAQNALSQLQSEHRTNLIPPAGMLYEYTVKVWGRSDHCCVRNKRKARGEKVPHAFFASFSTIAEPICPKLSHYAASICPQMVFEFGRVLTRTAEAHLLGFPTDPPRGSPTVYLPESASADNRHNTSSICIASATKDALHAATRHH